MDKSKGYSAFVKFSVGGRELATIPPKHIIGFQYIRKSLDAGNQFSLQVYDDSALQIEEAICKSGALDCSFQYGYTGGTIDGGHFNNISPVYGGILSSVDVRLNTRGVMLTIAGTSGLIKNQGQQQSLVWPRQPASGKRISDIVAEMATFYGWEVGKITPTAPLIEQKGIDGKPIPATFTQGQMNPMTFISSVLCKYAQTDSGEFGYAFRCEDLPKGRVKIYFERPDYSIEPKVGYTYSYGGSIKSTVISFEPQIHNTAFMGCGNVNVNTVDPTTNKPVVVSANGTTANTQSTGKKDVVVRDSNTNLFQSTGNQEKVGASANSYWTRASNLSYPATMEIVGDTRLNPQDNLSVAVILHGARHHSSGVYKIEEITDSIDGGTFGTSLSLTKTAYNIGVSNAPGNVIL